jgi:hypothetical protein
LQTIFSKKKLLLFKKMKLTPYITFVFLIAVTALIISLLDWNSVRSTSSNVLPTPSPTTESVLSLLPDADSLVITPNNGGQIQINGQAGVKSYGLTAPSNTLTLRDLRNLSQYVVGPDSTDSEYQSVSGALSAADTAGVTSNILIKQGTYDSETIDLVNRPQVFVGVGKNTAIIQNSVITQSLNDVVIWENVVFSNSSITLTAGITQFFNCIFINTTFSATNNSPNLYDCRVLGGLSVTGGNALDFQRTSFGGAVVVSNSSFVVGPLNCIFSEFTINNGLAPTIVENCTFRQTSLTVTSMPSCAFSNCSFANITTTITGPGTCSFNNCLFLLGNLITVPSPTVSVYFTNVTFVSYVFTPSAVGVNIQFLYCVIEMAATMEFQGLFADAQTLRFCTVNNAIPGGGTMIRVNGAGAYLRTNHCSFDGNSGGSSSIIFDFVGGAELVLYTATIICSQPQYATGTGTIIRPVTTDNLGNPQGTNLMNGAAVAAGTVTTTDTVPTWSFAPFKLV